MNKKKAILIFLFIFLGVFAVVVGLGLKSKPTDVVAQNEDTSQVYEVSSYITDEMRASAQNLGVDLLLNEEYTPQNLGQEADNIVLASVISIDSVKADAGLFGITKGKILINQTLRGNLEAGQVVEYMKNGGVMKMSEWEATQPESANAKRKYLREQAGLDIDLDNIYINILVSDDIEIKEGYTYLIYLKQNGESYEIIGLGTGLRQLDMPNTRTLSTQSLDVNTLKVMNNKTGEFESLQEYINKYINISDK